jgi:hypothetical protein
VTPLEVIVQQRLRTTAPAVVLGLAFLLVLNVSVIIANTTSGHAIPAIGLSVVLVALTLLLVVFLLALRIVVRVVTTSQGSYLQVAYGPGGFVRQVFIAGEIVSVSARDVSFSKSGGWGYRGSLVLLRRATLATRRGAALQLDLSKGRRFVVTVDDPEAFVVALQRPSKSEP